MSSTPLFSLIALVKDEKKHLLAATLNSLSLQTERRFEVIVVDGTGGKGLQEEIKRYDFSVRLCPAAECTSSEMMNEAVRISKGKYLQFLTPGDCYLSQEGLSYLSDLLKTEEPHLIYSGFLIQGSETILFPLDKKTLQKGVFSRDCWFLRKTILDLGGFDTKLSYRSGFDFLCRLYLRQGMNPICSRRVLTDGELKTMEPRAIFGYALETYQILYKHFGLWPAFRWVFVQNHLRMFRWVGRHLKAAFWQD